VFAAVAVLLFAAGTLGAHHSYGMFYDLRHTVGMTPDASHHAVTLLRSRGVAVRPLVARISA
jgi:hypothetical protein